MEQRVKSHHAGGPFRLEHCPDVVLLRRMLEDRGYIQPALARTVELEDTGKPFDLRMDVIALVFCVPVRNRRRKEIKDQTTLVQYWICDHRARMC